MRNSFIEALETRIAPATVLGAVDVFVDATTLAVSLTGGVLKISPLAGQTGLHLSVEQLPDGSFLISDLDGDADLETTPNFTGVVKGLAIGLSNGDDTLALSLEQEYLLPGSVSINAGLGDDQVEFLGGNIRGNVALAARGATDFTVGGLGLNVRGLLSATSLGGNFHFGADAHTGTLKAAGFSDFVLAGHVAGNAAFNGKAGETSYLIGSVEQAPVATIGGNLTVTGIAAGDDVFIDHALIKGALSLNLGAGENLATIGGDVTIFGLAKILASTGLDTVQWGSFTGGSPVLHGRLTVSLGSGTNTFTGASGVISGGFTYSGTTGQDTVVIGADLLLSNDARISLGDGNNVAVVENFSGLSKFGLTTGRHADQVWLSTVGAGYTVANVVLGLGNDILNVLGSGDVFSAFTADGGADSDTLNVLSAVIAHGFVAKKFETVL